MSDSHGHLMKAPAVSRHVVTATFAGTVVLAAGAFVLSFASLADLAPQWLRSTTT